MKTTRGFNPETIARLRRETAVNLPGCGDLSRPDAVVMGGRGEGRGAFSPEANTPLPAYREDDSLIINLSVTGRCFARCKGCINASITSPHADLRSLMTSSQDTVPERDARTILNLAAEEPERTTTVCFYGGEPFLAAGKMEETRALLSANGGGGKFRYMVYTNGEFLIPALDRFPDLMKEMWLYSFSIDGRAEQHRRVRPGTSLERIRENLGRLRRSCKGAVLMWSTLREEQSLLDCFEEFLNLRREGLADHLFWHWVETGEGFSDLPAYMARYGADLAAVMDVYVSEAEAGRLLPISHINELVLYLLSGRSRGSSACGVELADNYDIIGGRVCACADLPADLGNVAADSKGRFRPGGEELTSLVEYKEALGCNDCGVHAYCGGRCPVQALTSPPERTLQYCQLMRLHVAMVQSRLPEIERAFKKHNIGLQDIYDRSAFITRYTDVTP